MTTLLLALWLSAPTPARAEPLPPRPAVTLVCRSPEALHLPGAELRVARDRDGHLWVQVDDLVHLEQAARELVAVRSGRPLPDVPLADPFSDDAEVRAGAIVDPFVSTAPPPPPDPNPLPVLDPFAR